LLPSPFSEGFFVFYMLLPRQILKNTLKRVLSPMNLTCTFVQVFHRILDFKAGLDFYPGPFFMLPAG